MPGPLPCGVSRSARPDPMRALPAPYDVTPERGGAPAKRALVSSPPAQGLAESAAIEGPASPPVVLVQVDRPLRGIGLLLLSVFCFALSDAASKSLMDSMPATQVTWARFAVFALVMLPVVLLRGPVAWRSERPLLQVSRALGALLSALFFIASLGMLPLAEATAMSFVSPLFVTALSVPFLGERVGPRRWAAVVVGLLGVLIIVRPGTEAFHPAAVLPLLAAALWAGALVITRMMSGTDNTLVTLTYTAFLGLLGSSLLLPFGWSPMGWREVGLVAVSGLTATAAQGLVVVAYRHANASVLAPFIYSQLVWSAALGLAVFGHVPDSWTLAGAAVIVGSGLYTAHRERIRARQAS